MKNLGTKTIITDRLILRRFALSDAESMHEGWVTDKTVTQYVSWNVHKNLEKTIEVLKNWISEYENDNYNWVVEIKETSKLIGIKAMLQKQ